MTFNEFAPLCMERANKWIERNMPEDLSAEPNDTFTMVAMLRNCIHHGMTESPRDWTPCAEGLPEDNAEQGVEEIRCIATWITPYLKEEWVDRVKRVYMEKYGWYWLDPWGTVIDTVIAWQHLPAPYRADDTMGKVKEDEFMREAMYDQLHSNGN